MSEHDPAGMPLASETGTASDTRADAAARPRRGGTPLLLTLVLFAALGGGLYYVWQYPNPDAGGDSQASAEADNAALASAKAQIQSLSDRLEALEKRPAAPAGQPGAGSAQVDALGKRLDEVSATLASVASRQQGLQAEIGKLEDAAAQKPADAAQAQPAPDLGPVMAQLQAADAAVAEEKSALQAVDARLGKLEQSASQGQADTQGQAQDKAAFAALDDRIGKLEQGLAQSQGLADAQAQDKAAFDAMNARLAKLEQDAGQAQATEAAQAKDQSAFAALDQRVGKLEQSAGLEKSTAQDASLAIRLEAAQAALAAGQPLGDIPDAPPALARFAHAAPPTEAGLRGSFPAAAAAARAASVPDSGGQSFFQRALARMQESVTVRRGSHVIVGDPASGVLAKAQLDLDNGDLRGAVTALQGLNGPAAAAMAPWVAQVEQLLAARVALAAMAAHG
jgi:hypothetical protein